MRKHQRWAIPVAALGAAGLALALPVATAGAVAATTYQATLKPLNGSGGSGSLTLRLDGNQATVTESVTGLAATFGEDPYPHVQHIHIGARGLCPTASADRDDDQVVSTTEGVPFYGPVGVTLSTSGDTSPNAGVTLTVAPTGSDFTYDRTLTLDAASLASLRAGTAVVVVHGLDPATLSAKAQAAKSDLVPSLPLAATSPALCGPLALSQMSNVPGGAPGTGGGGTSGIEEQGLLALGGGLLLAAGGAFALRGRLARKS